MFEDTFQMKHLIFLIAATVLGGFGAIYHPFWGILLYYTLAVLRPQYLWNWALPMELRWSLFAAIIVFVSLMINAGRGFFRLKLQLVPTLIVAFTILMMGSAVNAYDPQTAQYWAIEYAKILAMALIASVVIDRLWQVRTMIGMIVLVLTYIAWEINYLYFAEGRLDIYHKGYGGLDNNGAGLMFAMGIPLAYAFAVSAKNRWVRLGCWGAAILMLHAMLMSYSRGAMVSAIVGVVWILLNHRPRFQAGLIAVIGMVAISFLAGEEIRERFRSSSNFESDASAQLRFDSWSAGWQIALDHPLSGQGIRNSKFFIQNYGGDKIGRTIHSQYIQIAADSGIPAMATYIAILCAALWSLRRSRILCSDYLDDYEKEHPDREPDRLTRQVIPLALGCEGSILIFAFGAVFLSMEVVELPWLLIVLAGILPHVAMKHIEHMQGSHAHHSPDGLKSAHDKNQELEREPQVCPVPSIIRGILIP